MDRVPRKKQRPPLRRRTVLLALVLCAALAAAAAFFLRAPAAVPFSPSANEAVMLLDRPKEEIVSVAIEPREGIKYPLVREGNGFILLGQPDVPLRDFVLDELLITLCELPAESVVLEHLFDQPGRALSDFGLDPPLARVTVTYTDGEKKELLVGDLAPNDETPQHYCMLGGDSHLYTILRADAETLLHDAAYLRDFDQPQLDGSLLDKIEITGDTDWTLHYTPSGWYMDEPFSYPLSTVRTDALLKRIESIGFEACLGEADQLDLAALGLSSPALNIRITQAATVLTGVTTEGETVSLPVPETAYTLLIGAETGKSGVYVQWENRVYTASNFLLGFWKSLNPRDFLLQTPVNLLVNDLTEVAFTCPGVAAGYEVRMVENITENNQIATDEYGRVLYDCAVRRAGEAQDMDAAAFLSWYTRLSSLAPDGELPPGFTLQGDSEAQIVLKNDHLTRVIAFYPYDALHCAVAVDGTALYYVQKTWLDKVKDVP